MTKFPWDEPSYIARRNAYSEVLSVLLLRDTGRGRSARLRLFYLTIAAIIALVGWQIYQPVAVTDVSYGEIASHLAQRRVTSWKIDEGKIIVSTASGNRRAPIPADKASELWQALVLSGAPVASKQLSWLHFASPLAVVLVLVGMLWFIGLTRTSSSNPTLSFGRSRARLLTGGAKKVTFKDFAGSPPKQLLEVIEFLKEPQTFTKLGGRMPKAVLLVGPPGSGKTLLARATAGECNVPFFYISGTEFVEMFPGVGASRIRDLLEQGKKNAPCILFIDDIDAVARRRIGCPDPLKLEQELTLSQLLWELDGFESNDGVIVMAATNRPDLLDEALLRPGRFEVTIDVSHPTAMHFEKMLRISTRAVPLDSDVDLSGISAQLHTRLPNALGDVVAVVVNNATIQAAKAGAKKVGNSFFLEAIENEVARNIVLHREHES